jgi:hypothetical protein
MQTNAEAASITTAIEWPTEEAPLLALLAEVLLLEEAPVELGEESVSVSVGEESEVSVGLESEVSVGLESEVSVGLESEVSVGVEPEGEVPVAATLPAAPEPVAVEPALAEFDATLGAMEAADGVAFDFDELVVAAPAAAFVLVAAKDDVGAVGGIDVIVFATEFPLGGGTAAAELASFPVPHGMAWLVPGWVDSDGGVVWPELDAMAKRVVHSVSGEPGDVNWKKYMAELGVTCGQVKSKEPETVPS